MTNKEIAQTILAQLGGHKFVAMTGAYSFTHGDQSLSMRLPTKLTKGIGGVRITLDASDTYTMIAFKQKGSFAKGNFEVAESFKESGIYCDQLTDFFTEATGLATSL